MEAQIALAVLAAVCIAITLSDAKTREKARDRLAAALRALADRIDPDGGELWPLGTPALDAEGQPLPRCTSCGVPRGTLRHALICSGGGCNDPDAKRAATGVGMIAAERKRQVEVEGYSAIHDNGHDDLELLDAALSYLRRAADGQQHNPEPPALWPWAARYWKPTDDPVRMIVKAGALIAADIDRRLAATDPDAVRR